MMDSEAETIHLREWRVTFINLFFYINHYIYIYIANNNIYIENFEFLFLLSFLAESTDQRLDTYESMSKRLVAKPIKRLTEGKRKRTIKRNIKETIEQR